jgi:hypothetical protein
MKGRIETSPVVGARNCARQQEKVVVAIDAGSALGRRPIARHAWLPTSMLQVSPPARRARSLPPASLPVQ